MIRLSLIFVLSLGIQRVRGFISTTGKVHSSNNRIHCLHSSLTDITSSSDSSWFTSSAVSSTLSVEKLKIQILQLGAALDRGQAYNPTSGEYYGGTMDIAREKIRSLISRSDPNKNIPRTLEDISGEWELVLTTVKHGIFRSSPFFLAVQEAFGYAEEKGRLFVILILNI